MEDSNALMDDVSTEPSSIWGLLQKDIRGACSWIPLILIGNMAAIFGGTAGRGHIFFGCAALYLAARWKFPKSEVSMVSLSAESSFLVQHIRIMILLASIILFSGFVPLFKIYIGAPSTENFPLLAGGWYALGFLSSFGLIVECIVWRSLLNPSPGSFEEQWEQVAVFFRNTGNGVGLAFYFLMLDWAWEKLLSPNPVFRWAPDILISFLEGLPLPEIMFPSSFLFLIIWVIQNHRRWCGTE